MRCHPSAVHMLEMVRLNGYKLLDLINRLLDFSKLEAGQMKLAIERLDLNGLIEQLTQAATPLAQQRGIELSVDCDPELGSLRRRRREGRHDRQQPAFERHQVHAPRRKHPR